MPLRINLLFVWLCFVPLLQAQVFEGAITLQVQSDQQNGTLELWLSPKGIRADFKGTSAFTIVLPRDSANAYRLDTKAKTFREIDLQEQRRLSASIGKLEKFEVEKFGKEKILNVMCHHFMLKSAKRTIEVWTAESLVDSTTLTRLADAGALIGISPNAVEVMQKENLNGFPLKVIASEPTGSARIEAKRITRKSFKPSFFEVPKSFRDVDSKAEVN
ncbi:MAG: DUF4412 domain-containing protein [Chloroherpetonaceae bacterium]